MMNRPTYMHLNTLSLQAIASSQEVTSELHLLNTPFNLISFKQTLAFHNLLPVALRVAERVGAAEADAVTLQPGETRSMHFVDPTKNQEFSVEARWIFCFVCVCVVVYC